jgi:DNA-binding LacI/PurR family transcriptional regulator
LAHQLGISIGTVSRALNNRYGVNSNTRARVLEQARRLNYVPNSAARRLKESTVLTVGLFFAPFLSHCKEVSPTALRLIDLFRERLNAQKMTLQVIFHASDQDLKDQSAINQIDVAVFYGEFPPFGSSMKLEFRPSCSITRPNFPGKSPFWSMSAKRDFAPWSIWRPWGTNAWDW